MFCVGAPSSTGGDQIPSHVHEHKSGWRSSFPPKLAPVLSRCQRAIRAGRAGGGVRGGGGRGCRCLERAVVALIAAAWQRALLTSRHVCSSSSGGVGTSARHRCSAVRKRQEAHQKRRSKAKGGASIFEISWVLAISQKQLVRAATILNFSSVYAPLRARR